MREREERVSELFRRHADDIHAYASWRVGPQDAADVVSEVFLVACRSVGRVRVGEERGWLFGVARKVVLARHRRGAATTALTERMAGLTTADAELDGMADEVALRDQVRRALDTLGERDREALVMAAWFDLSPAQAARALGVSRPAYAVRLHRARGRFRTAYEQITRVDNEALPPVRRSLTA